MPLPEWAAAPGPNYQHGDNYSSMEVVWTDTETHDVVIQTALRSILLSPGSPNDILGLPESPLDILAETRGLARGAVDAAEEAHRRLVDQAQDIEGWGRTVIGHHRDLHRLRVRWLPFAAAVGAVGGIVGVHFHAWPG